MRKKNTTYSLTHVGLVLLLSFLFQFIPFVFLPQTYAGTDLNQTKLVESKKFDDASLPIISIDAPLTSIAYSTRKIFVYGSADGTGSKILEVLINGQPAELIQLGNESSEKFNFFGDVEFKSDGKFTITVNARDKAGNTSDTNLEVIIDTVFPRLSPAIEKFGDQLKVTGLADGTGSNILAIYVNEETIQPIFQEKTEFSIFVGESEVPIVISVVDFAGNQSILIIRDPFAVDLAPPHIRVLTPSDGQSFEESPKIEVKLEVTDDFSVKEVSVNGVILTESDNGIFSGNFILNPGVNLISIKAVDINDNEATEKIEVSYFPKVGEIPVSEAGLPEEKAYIVLPPPTRDLSDIIFEEFLKILEQYLTDIASLGSIEIANPPIISKGPDASVEAPKFKEFDIFEETSEGLLVIPKGFAFASDVNFSTDPGKIELSEEKGNQNVTLLVDSRGKTFAIGFALFQEPQSNSSARIKKYRYQTTDGQSLDLTTTLTIPTDAVEGDAKVTIIRGNNSLATIPLKIGSSKDVKVRNKIVAKPEISNKINAIVEKSGKQLKLRIKGKNFVGRTAIIDGKLEKLVSKANFFTNVTFIPDEGIKIKKFKLVNSETIILTAELSENITPGIKLFNVITPKGADIGAIIFPSPITDGQLETTATPESLLIEDTNLE
ncbi:MAG: hypothetical protein A3I68_07475 [Candidatus Melainabacteria bacterium RIFCSPLOWO2_02_FULL_35_15]|nr:MAG: hypothetical protein A3F80_04720 [Candidatus Melainabacteria bacterium RIFCSPLOWO2_12_FULL_35_11]OGI13784.1 MAG: hypothetical protein A3I68_07475 [Candidatus Melainabacteria bacterium RIFCSPLOWO2_02_FULL_35_15]